MKRHLFLAALVSLFGLATVAQAKPLKFAGPGEKCWFQSTSPQTPTQSVVRKCGLGNANIKQFCYWHCASVRGGSTATCNNACKLNGARVPAPPSRGGEASQPREEDSPATQGRRRRGSASEAYCKTNPYSSECRSSESYCRTNPYSSECRGSEAYCKTNPYSSECRKSESYCETNPYSAECRKSEAYCKTNPYSSDCRSSESYCRTNPYSSECRGSEAYCETNPYSSECR